MSRAYKCLSLSQETIDLSPEREVIFFMVGTRDMSINATVPSQADIQRTVDVQTQMLIIACLVPDGNIH